MPASPFSLSSIYSATSTATSSPAVLESLKTFRPGTVRHQSGLVDDRLPAGLYGARAGVRRARRPALASAPDRARRGVLELRDRAVRVCGEFSHAVRGSRSGGRRRGRLRHHRTEFVVGLFSGAPARPGHGDFLLRHSGRLGAWAMSSADSSTSITAGARHFSLQAFLACCWPPRACCCAIRRAASRIKPQGLLHPRRPNRHRASAKDALLTYARLLRNKPYALTVLGYAAYTFAIGGLAYWMPAFLERARGIPRSEATVSFGTIVVVTGFVGTFVGGWMGDYFAKNSRQAYLWLSAARHARRGALCLVGPHHGLDRLVHGLHGDGATLLVPIHRPDQCGHRQSGHRQRARHGDRSQRVRHSSARRRGVAIDRRRALGRLLARRGNQDSAGGRSGRRIRLGLGRARSGRIEHRRPD